MTAINKFNKSLLYTIRSPATEQYYIGSTTQKLCKRFSDHNINYKAYLKGSFPFITSFKIIELGDAYIELLEEISCENRNQLVKREGELIREHKANCVNRNIAGRTHKEYYFDNSDKILEKMKQYYIDNNDKISEQRKEYYAENNDKILEQKKEYYAENNDKILEQRKQYYAENKEKKKQYYIDNIEKILEQKKQYRLENSDKINEQRRAKRTEKKLLKDLESITI